MVQFLISTVEFLATIALSIFGIDYTPAINCDARFYEQASSEIIAYVDDDASTPEAAGTRATTPRVKIPASCIAS